MSSALTLSSPARFARTNNYWHYQPRIRAGFCTLERPDRCLKDRVHLSYPFALEANRLKCSPRITQVPARYRAMFNSTVLDVAVGLIFMFLALSLAVSS